MRMAARSGVLLVLLVLVAIGCARMRAMTMSKDDAIAARQQLMKEQGATMRSISDKAKAGQFQAIAPEAEKLTESSRKITAYFPKDSVDPTKSRAKPEIWQKWSEFEGYAKALETQSKSVAATARTGDAQATNAAVTKMGRETCGGCHNAFRGPEIKK